MEKDTTFNGKGTASWYLGRIGEEASIFVCTNCYELTPVINESLYMPSKNIYNLFPVCPCCGIVMQENKDVKIDKVFSFKSMSLNRKGIHR